jgi:hypothetical protein
MTYSGIDHLEQDTVTADISELRSGSEKVKHFVGRGVAHSDRRSLPDEFPTLKDVHESIDVVGRSTGATRCCSRRHPVA